MSTSQEANNQSSTTSPSSQPVVSSQRPPRPPPPRTLPHSSSIPQTIQQHLESLQCLREERVRWFVKEDKKWTPFNGSDSLAIERCYRRIQELELRKEDASKPLNTNTIYELPTVKGRLYEVDVVPRECIPIYWEDKGLPVCRGTWFYGSSPETWQPVSEEDAEQIEASHQAIWRSLGFSGSQNTEEDTGTNSKQTLGHLQLKGYHVEWNDESDVSLYWDDVKSRIMRGVIGMSSASSPLHRGYHTNASPEDKPPEISHMVFVVHGIGQLLHMSNIVKSCSDLRRCTARVLEKHSAKFSPDQRLEFFPIEWRSSLKLDEGTIECITPSTVPGLRKALNTSMMDIMYYTSPFYRYEIIDGVRDELNRMYETFCARNPSFAENNGKVSIVSHSLGSVIAYDILSLWDIEERHLSDDATAGTGFLTESFTFLRSFSRTDSAPCSPPSKEKKPKENLRVELAKARSRVMELEAQLKNEVEHGKEAGDSAGEQRLALKFKVESLYCLGSPLAVFLALRGLRPQDDVEDHVLPKSVCKRVVNIYHPADPIAYRLEPLISEDYSSIPPLQLHRFDSQKSGYNEGKKSKSGGGTWKMLASAYTKMGYRKSKRAEETSDDAANGATGGEDQEGEEEDDEVVIVDHNVDAAGVGGERTAGAAVVVAAAAAGTGGQASTDGASAGSRGGWISWFGRSSRANSTDQGGGDRVDSHPESEAAKEHIQVPEKALSERLDFVLREGYMESNYWSAVTSHISYWGSCDVARFILENSMETADNAQQS